MVRLLYLGKYLDSKMLGYLVSIFRTMTLEDSEVPREMAVRFKIDSVFRQYFVF